MYTDIDECASSKGGFQHNWRYYCICVDPAVYTLS